MGEATKSEMQSSSFKKHLAIGQAVVAINLLGLVIIDIYEIGD